MELPHFICERAEGAPDKQGFYFNSTPTQLLIGLKQVHIIFYQKDTLDVTIKITNFQKKFSGIGTKPNIILLCVQRFCAIANVIFLQ